MYGTRGGTYSVRVFRPVMIMVYHEKSGTVDAIENTVANVINATYVRHTIKRLGLTASVYNGFLIACIVNSLWLG